MSVGKLIRALLQLLYDRIPDRTFERSRWKTGKIPGFLLNAVERVAGSSLNRSRTRQVAFEYRGHQFKARFTHHAGPRGGIEIVEVLPDRGAPEGDVAVSRTCLDEAEDVYLTLEARLDKFIDAEEEKGGGSGGSLFE